MQLLFAIFLFFLLSILHKSVLAETLLFASIQDDLAEFNKTCNREHCRRNCGGSFPSRDCDCGKQCVQLGTCCVDSPYAQVRQPKLKHSCRQVYHGGYSYYFIVDQCPFVDSVWASSCNHELGDDDDDDYMLKIIPVTSLMTSFTYKNYYCFRCHETTDDFLYWNVRLENEYVKYNTSKSEEKNEDISLNYDKVNGIWMASYGESTLFPVQLTVVLPDEVLTHDCEPNVISDCSDEWKDTEIERKCQSYMALKEVIKNGTILKYKNVHCALCNLESLNAIRCNEVGGRGSGFAGGVTFSFTFLLDVNRSDGELVGKIQKCTDDHLWDPYTKKCRKLTCALPGHKVKNGKCIPE